MAKQRDREKPPVDPEKLWKPALAIVILAIVYSLFSAVLSGNRIEVLDVGDSLVMREVFFGEGSFEGSYVSA